MSNSKKFPVPPDGKVRVLYYDILGFESNGVIALMQRNPESDDEPYCFIVDDNPELNDKEYKSPDGSVLKYAEIRRSTEIIRIS